MSNTQEINSRLNFFNFFFNNFDVIHCISNYPDKILNCISISIPFIKNLIKRKKFKKNFSAGWLDHSVNESLFIN